MANFRRKERLSTYYKGIIAIVLNFNLRAIICHFFVQLKRGRIPWLHATGYTLTHPTVDFRRVLWITFQSSFSFWLFFLLGHWYFECVPCKLIRSWKIDFFLIASITHKNVSQLSISILIFSFIPVVPVLQGQRYFN